MKNVNINSDNNRPKFPKKAVITAGMPYGNKELHFGHIGGVFVQADTFARFLRDRIGKENIIFVSGTDCYGSPIVEHYRKLIDEGQFEGSIEEFVKMNHKKQKEVLDKYHIDINLFASSSFNRSSEIHKEISDYIINTLYDNGHLVKVTTSQFYDTEMEQFLNGRQVTGQCPIDGCSSDKGYADECSLGHQYMPSELINPKSSLTGKKPEMKDVTNWYLKLESFHSLLKEWVESLKNDENSRKFVIKSIEEFLEPPVIYIKKNQIELLDEIKTTLPKHTVRDENKKSSIVLVFENLKDREDACILLAKSSIRYRTGKTLVPFRLTGNIEWGVKAPNIEDLKDLTVWVWPESLWAPISFTKTYLESKKMGNNEEWKNWWCSDDSKVFQFIGEDNIYFYGPVEMSMFMGLQGKEPSFSVKDGDIKLPWLVANNHILFLDKKASSSGKIKPPMAGELLNYYTAEQLRGHFLGLGLGMRSVGFRPKPLNPKAGEKEGDPVLKEGNLLANVFNRAIRSCFYTVQEYYNGKIPVGNVSEEIKNSSKEIILEFEKLIYKCEFHQVMNTMDVYIRNINKYWSKNMKQAEKENDENLRTQALIDTFHMVRTAAVLMHPIAPEGTEMLCDYLNFKDDFWSWDNIFDTIYDFMGNPNEHEIKFLEPRVDFFKKHPSQFKK
jgi:methionyl-tRNA synthetase